MNSRFQSQPDFKQKQNVQSFYEPALQVLNEVYQSKRDNLQRRGYNQDNAAVTKEELSQRLAGKFRITTWLAQEVISSLIRSKSIESFGGYVRPKAGEQ